MWATLHNYYSIYVWVSVAMHYISLHTYFTDPTKCQDGVTNNCTETCTRSVFNGTSFYECGCCNSEGFELNPDNTTCSGKYESPMRLKH